MKKIISGKLLAFALFLTLVSFAPIKQGKSFSKNPLENESIITTKKIVIIQFFFSLNGCTYEVFAAINTANGTGAGTIKRTCPGQPVQQIWYMITGATVVRGIEPENFEDFQYEDESPAEVSEPEVNNMVEGFNDCEDWNDD